MADPRHPHELTPKAWCAVCLTPIAVDRSFCAIHAPTDLSDWDHYAEEPVDSGMSAKSVERAEFLWASLPVTRKWTSLATHEKALVCHLLDRELAANKAKLEAAEEMAEAPVWQFLLGEGPLFGCHFGENPVNERGNFWWRKHLRATLAKWEKANG